MIVTVVYCNDGKCGWSVCLSDVHEVMGVDEIFMSEVKSFCCVAGSDSSVSV